MVLDTWACDVPFHEEEGNLEGSLKHGEETRQNGA